MPTESCIFCQIVNNEVDASIVYRDQEAVAFRDIHPAAPTHILIVPTQHVASLNQLQAAKESVSGESVRRRPETRAAGGLGARRLSACDQYGR